MNFDEQRLEEGMCLFKVGENKDELNERFYRLDLNNNQIIATTTHCFKKEKIYPLIQMDAVKSGPESDNFKSLIYQVDNINNRAFVIFYDNYRKDLSLVAPNRLDRDAWCRVLNTHIENLRIKKKISETKLNEIFEKYDADKNERLEINEIDRFINSLNLDLNKDDLKAKIREVDKNNDNKLDKQEFEDFFKKLNKRSELEELFYKYLIEQYEINKHFKQIPQFSVAGFKNYMSQNFLMDSDKESNVYHSDNYPLHSYFINSSHNTYLSGDQLQSMSNTDCYRAAIMNGARLLEMDVYDDPKGPRIFHNYTLTSKISFEDALIVCKKFAFEITDYPLILTLEMHCVEQKDEVARLIKTHLKDHLFDPENYIVTERQKPGFPYLKHLKRKILIRCKTDEKDNELAKIVNLMQSFSFPGIEEAFKKYFPLQSYNFFYVTFGNKMELNSELETIKTASLSEIECNKLIKANPGNTIVNFTSKFLKKVYPAGYRALSDNFDPFKYWIYGFQIVALNFQKDDKSMHLNRGFFADNGNCGYLLKPEILRDASLNFNPTDVTTLKTYPKKLTIRIISGQNLPINENVIRDYSDPFVTVTIHGIPADYYKVKTKTIKDNGFNPVWDEKFDFIVNCSELAMLRLSVLDEDVAVDDFIGHYEIRFECLRQGYRHVKLINPKKQGTLFVHVKIDH